ncbi:MAG: hypothetical protein EHM28_03835 [Spirochaetaceae bacterium]|nr:MAG: hypothetical protein EHM28_03835 [Spirochaetaceae bacterium]
MDNLIPKAEIHCHLDGLISPAYLKQLHSKSFAPEIKEKEFSRYFPIRTLSEWYVFQEYIRKNQFKNGQLMLKILRIHLEELVRQKVDYIEMMLTGILLQFEDDEDELCLINEYIRLAESFADRIIVNYLVAIGRTRDLEKLGRQIHRIKLLFELGHIKGMAVAGDESACTIQEHARVFDEFYEARIPVEIHAGEWLGPESIWDALRYGKPRRIGHGVSAVEDPKLLYYILDHDIHIEVCPTSNMILTKYRDVHTHPVNTFNKLGISFSINTDDPGHFGCTMESEYELLKNECGFYSGDFERIYHNTMRSAFQS